VEPPGALAVTLAHMEARVLAATNCREARQLLASEGPMDVVVTEVSLPDGNWCDLLLSMVKHGLDASLVVISGSDDQRLWSEVLWRGAYDMLVEPFGPEEARRALEGAWRAQTRVLNAC
jgi:DNA-binding NtrC family response regulator